MEVLVCYAGAVELFGHYACHSLPLAEYHGFLVAAFDECRDKLQRFGYFGVEAGLLVDYKGTVAGHAHAAEQ